VRRPASVAGKAPLIAGIPARVSGRAWMLVAAWRAFQSGQSKACKAWQLARRSQHAGDVEACKESQQHTAMPNMRGKQQDPHLPRFAFLPNDTPSYGGCSSSACTTNSPQAAGTATGAAVIAAASTAQTKRQGCARASMQMAMFGTHYTATEDNGARCRVRIRERNEYLFLSACTLSCQGAGSCPDPPTLHHPSPRFCTDIAAPADCALKWCPDCAPVSLARCNCMQRWAPQAHLSWQAAHGTAAREDGGHGSEILVLMHAAWAQPSASGCCSVQPRWPWGGAHQKQQEHSRRTCTSAAAGEQQAHPPCREGCSVSAGRRTHLPR
jgi:hypothetical protein